MNLLFLNISIDNNHQFGLLGQVGLEDQVPGIFPGFFGYIFHLQRIGKTGSVFFETPMDEIR